MAHLKQKLLKKCDKKQICDENKGKAKKSKQKYQTNDKWFNDIHQIKILCIKIHQKKWIKIVRTNVMRKKKKEKKQNQNENIKINHKWYNNQHTGNKNTFYKNSQNSQKCKQKIMSYKNY